MKRQAEIRFILNGLLERIYKTYVNYGSTGNHLAKDMEEFLALRSEYFSLDSNSEE